MLESVFSRSVFTEISCHPGLLALHWWARLISGPFMFTSRTL